MKLTKIRAGVYQIVNCPELTVESWSDAGCVFWDVWHKNDLWIGHFRALSEVKQWLSEKGSAIEVYKALQELK